MFLNLAFRAHRKERGELGLDSRAPVRYTRLQVREHLVHIIQSRTTAAVRISDRSRAIKPVVYNSKMEAPAPRRCGGACGTCCGTCVLALRTVASSFLTPIASIRREHHNT